MRQTWKGINELIGSYKKKNKRNPTKFIRPNPNEVPTSDPKEISNILNKYFATVGSKLASKIPQTIGCVHMTSRRPCWRSKQRIGGHVGGVKYSFGNRTLSLCKSLPLLHYANMASDQMSEHTL